MPSACGVSWDGTSGGKLEEGSIPDPPDHKSHYLNAADTKGDSSFPVVDGEGNLRAGNVNSAWDLRGQGDGVSEECLRKLDNAFDDDVLPDSAYDNSSGDTRVSIDANDTDEQFGINLEFRAPPEQALAEGFNRYGVRENEDGSVDVRFNAMEPGVRRGIEITPEFLRNVVQKEYSRLPLQLDHSDSQRANVGYIEPENLKFGGSDGMLQVQAHIPNTGNSLRDDIIADFTHEPPQITDISASFDKSSVEVEAPESRDEPPKFKDARLRELSLTPFPAGYDNGGLTPAFSDAVEAALDFEEDGRGPASSSSEDAESNLIKRPHYLIEK